MSTIVRRIRCYKALTESSLRRMIMWVSPTFAVLIFCIVGVIATLPASLWAGQTSDLYKTELPIVSQSEESKTIAMKEALSNIFVKVTGEILSLANDTVKKAINEPNLYLKGYSYRKDTTSSQQFIQITFVEEAVNRVLREAGLAIWGANRPTILTWLAIDDTGKRSIQIGGTTEPLIMELEKRFTARSLPLIFPLLDFEDSQRVSPVDVWGLFTNKLTQASKRYNADAILAGRLSVNSGKYNGRLSLVFRGKRQDVDITNQNHEQLSLVAADLAGSILSRHYAVASLDAKESTVLVIEQVNSTKDYSNVVNYLEGLTAVRSVNVRKIAGSQLELELSIDGYSNQLTDAIALGRRLKPVKSSEKIRAPEKRTTLNYRWVQH